MFSTARLTFYIGAALAGLAVMVSALGYADYDPATGLIDLHPFNVYSLAAIIAGPVASLLAAVALALGWGGKK
jgi:branched-subunit amino acid ABC-type transport system permease component